MEDKSRNRKWLLGWLAGILLLSSCNVNKYLKEDDILVKQNKIVLETERPVDQQNLLLADLRSLYKQQATSNFSAWYYFKTNRATPDTSAFRKFIMRWSKEPSYFNEGLTQSTVRSLNNQMIQRGFFDARTDYSFDIRNQRAYITYQIKPGVQYKVNTIQFESQDSTIQALMERSRRDSHLRPGKPVDQRLYELEVNRITSLLQNHGYANFFSTYVAPLRGDSCDHRVDLQLEVLPQQGGLPHVKYTIGRIRVFSNFNPEIPRDSLQSLEYNNIAFLSPDGMHPIKPRALNDNIFLKSGDVYNRSNFDKSLRRLGRLGAIKFVSIRPEQDLENPEVLNYNVYVTAAPKIAFNADVDINNSNLSIINQRFLGLAGRVGLRHRNLFGGAENNVTDISGGLELATRSANFRDSTNYYFRIQNSLALPKFLDFPGIFRLLNWVKIGNTPILSDAFYTNLQEDATTNFDISADFVSQKFFYSYTSLNFNYGFDMVIANRKRYTINQTGINFFTPSFSQNFVEGILNNNEFIRRSLSRQMFTGFFFRDLTFKYTSLTNRANETYSFSSNFEVSGAELALAGALIGKPITNLNDSTQFSKYVRLDTEGRYTRVYNDKHSAAFRINVGIASPFESSPDVPFVKQFFVGGGLSIRAWQMRELGPGSYYDTTLVERGGNDRFQTGDFKFELNGEYRFRLFWKLETATFLDIGNVWILREDPQRPGARLTAGGFFRDMAIGSGAGLRIVFDFFIIRLDLGVKVKNPYKLNGSYWARGNFSELTNLNLAINYSF